MLLPSQVEAVGEREYIPNGQATQRELCKEICEVHVWHEVALVQVVHPSGQV